MLYSKEFYEIIESFEKTIKTSSIRTSSLGFEKEDKELWKSGIYYCDGDLNNLFKLFLNGVMLGKIL